MHFCGHWERLVAAIQQAKLKLVPVMIWTVARTLPVATACVNVLPDLVTVTAMPKMVAKLKAAAPANLV